MGMVIGFILGFLGALAGAISIYTHYVMPLVPAGEYHGLIQLGVGVISVLTFGGAVIGIAVLSGIILAFVIKQFVP